MVVMAVIWFVAAMDRVVMPLITLTGVERLTPDLRLIPYAKADSLCRALGLTVEISRGRPDSKAAPGSILDQYPAAGLPVKPGKKIEVVVCDSAGMATTPNVIGRSPQEAALAAASAGLNVADEHIRHANSWEYPAGVVISQTPKPDEIATPGRELILTVSLGQPPDEVIVPNLVGMPSEGVEELLERTGLHLGERKITADSAMAIGIVLGQEPTAGANVPVGAKVMVRVASRGAASPAPAPPAASPTQSK
jgi:beta-lactam-binding protein with PASTA domain